MASKAGAEVRPPAAPPRPRPRGPAPRPSGGGGDAGAAGPPPAPRGIRCTTRGAARPAFVPHPTDRHPGSPTALREKGGSWGRLDGFVVPQRILNGTDAGGCGAGSPFPVGRLRERLAQRVMDPIEPAVDVERGRQG